MFKFALNAGHYNGTTRGIPASLSPNNHPNEWVLNDRVCDKVESLLKQYDGISVLRIDDTTGKTYDELSDRTDKANAWGADFYLAIHHNGGIGGGTGGGIVAYVYTSPSAESVAWQKDLYNALVKKTGLKGNRATPIARENLHEVRETKMPSVLLELGFMDSKTDIKYILASDWSDKCAAAIVEVIVKRKGLKKKVQGMKQGDKSDGVFALKRLLMLCYKYKITSVNLANDGVFGEGTTKAVKEVQKAAKINQTGIADEATIRAAYVLLIDKIDSNEKAASTKLKKAQTDLATANAKIASTQKQLDSIVSGDVNGDGAVNMKDVLALRKELAN